MSPLIDLALSEDLADRGDVTTNTFVPETHRSTGVIAAREPAVIAGTQLVVDVFAVVDPSVEVEIVTPDGSELSRGEVAFRLSGSTRAILTAERTALNFLQRLSGIATKTREFVKRVEGTRAQILDTRKTTPGWRALEKDAVLAGGGTNHRIGLYDRVMVKDNHLVAEPSSEALQSAMAEIRGRYGIPIELEADTLEQVSTFLSFDPPVDRILLDNMSNSQLREAVTMRGDRPIELEASGGVNLSTVSEIAETGVDYISVGAITHSAIAVDFGLDLASA